MKNFTVKPKKKLTVTSLTSLKDEGFYRDHETVGLYVQISYRQHADKRDATHVVTRSCVYRYRSPITGKGRWMGLGPCDLIGIHEARELAREARRLVIKGIDPIDDRHSKIEEKRQAAIKE